VSNSCGPVVRILDDILISCQNTATLEAAHQLLRTLTSNPKFSGGVDTAEMLEDVLDGIGFGGLWRSSSFHIPNEHERQCTALTDRLIEVCQLIFLSQLFRSHANVGRSLSLHNLNDISANWLWNYRLCIFMFDDI
jgi:hypothetical protein